MKDSKLVGDHSCSSTIRTPCSFSSAVFFMLGLPPMDLADAMRVEAVFALGGFGYIGIALTFGLVVLAMIYTVGDISGAHLNPAVTLGFFAAGRCGLKTVPGYIASQLLGDLTAGLAASDDEHASIRELPGVPIVGGHHLGHHQHRPGGRPPRRLAR